MLPLEYPETLRFESCDKPTLPSRSSVFTDIFKAVDREKPGVAVKIFRVHAIPKDRTKDLEKKFLKEAEKWAVLRHENIAPITIFKPSFDSDSQLLSFPRIIMYWYEKGDVRSYTKKFPATDRLALIAGITCALDYLHDHHIVHGSVYPPNILIDDQGNPVITDMEHSKIFTAEYYHVLSSPGGEKFRYSSPEWTMDSEHTAYMSTSDVWSFACTALELLTEVRPFAHIVSDVAVVLALHDRKKPFNINELVKPTYVAQDYMDTLFSCLDLEVESRPSMKDMLKQ
ncbi:kinase-like domain-containing protein [Cyathus striatus]|nr:kinase-like domain-containing protein [Cyathus striatus]